MKRFISNETNLSMDHHPFRSPNNRIGNIDAYIEKNLSKNKIRMNNTNAIKNSGTKLVEMYQSLEGMGTISMSGSIASNSKMHSNIK